MLPYLYFGLFTDIIYVPLKHFYNTVEPRWLEAVGTEQNTSSLRGFEPSDPYEFVSHKTYLKSNVAVCLHFEKHYCKYSTLFKNKNLMNEF